MTEEKLKEYKILQNATNGYHLIADDAIHLNKEQATEKYWGYVNSGENPNDLKAVLQDDVRFPTGSKTDKGWLPTNLL